MNSVLGMMMNEALNESKRKFWQLPQGTITYAATETNIKLGLSTMEMDNTLRTLWKKHLGHFNNEFYVIDPTFKRGTYQKADELYRKYYELSEKSGDYEVWIQKGKSGKPEEYAFYNKKTKQWISNYMWICWNE